MKYGLVALSLAVIVPTAFAGEWKYQTDTDKMDGTVVKFALLRSTNSMSLPFPYQGTNHGSLQVRQRKSDGLSAIFAIDKGQLICRGGASFGTCSVQVRFDDAQPINFTASGSDDNSSKVLFLSPAKRFVESAAKAKRIRVAATLYQSGTQILDFDVATPLTWDAGPASRPAPAKASPPSVTAQPATPPTVERMKACNLEAGDRLGDERKNFMKECLTRK